MGGRRELGGGGEADPEWGREEENRETTDMHKKSSLCPSPRESRTEEISREIQTSKSWALAPGGMGDDC